MKKHKFSSISEINVTSLVDVTKVLLIIFMITAPLLRSGIEVDLPRAQVEPLPENEGIIVSINQAGQLYLNGDRVQEVDFNSRLLQEYETSGRKTVLLQADQQIPYGQVIQVMDRIKRVGITNLGLVVETKEKK